MNFRSVYNDSMLKTKGIKMIIAKVQIDFDLCSYFADVSMEALISKLNELKVVKEGDSWFWNMDDEEDMKVEVSVDFINEGDIL